MNCDMLQRVWAEMDYRLDIAYYNPFRHSSVPILWNMSGIMNNSVHNSSTSA
jgi:hypothetical protein